MLSRRSVLIAALAAASGAWGQGTPLTPSCGRPTERQTAGPYFKPDSPRRTNMLESAPDATLLVVTGMVLSRECRPVAGALLDFWHADEFGEYDNKGFRHRGHQFTDAQGRWRLETVLPAEYPGRARTLRHRTGARQANPDDCCSPGRPARGLYRDSLVIR